MILLTAFPNSKTKLCLFEGLRVLPGRFPLSDTTATSVFIETESITIPVVLLDALAISITLTIVLNQSFILYGNELIITNKNYCLLHWVVVTMTAVFDLDVIHD